MLRAYKYRLEPLQEQLLPLEQHFGAVRLVYNLALEVKSSSYKIAQKNISRFDLQKQLIDLKEGFEWLWDINSQSLQASLLNLDTAYKNFFERRADFPKFKSKHDKKSFSCPQNCSVDWGKSLLHIPKFKAGIPIVLHRTFKGNIKTVTISKTPTGKYFASILVDNEKPLPVKPAPDKDNAIGIDRNLLNFATYGNTARNISFELPNPKYLLRSLELVKKRSRQLSKKKKGSKNWQKAKLKLARKHEKIANQRKDILHKYSYRIVVRDSQSNTICMEDLNIKGMVQNRKLSRSISDVGWGMFEQFIQYKSDWTGKNVLFAPRFSPTSKQCKCGYIHNGLTLADRVWICPECKSENVRDILSHDNIIHFAFESYYKKHRDGLPESTPVEFSPLSSAKRIRKARTKKQEKFRNNNIVMQSVVS